MPYKGFHPKKEWKPARLTSPNPIEFYKNYIHTRTPVILHLDIDYSWLSIDNLLKYGDRIVQVEAKKNETFGNGGTRTEMKFKDFVKELPKGELYLTTQYKESLDDQSVDIHSESDELEESLLQSFAAPPLDALLPDIPYQLEIFNNMVLHQMNLWIGYANDKGTTSGLHFDYHDNFYFLQKGKKRFTIFSPKDAENLYLEGEIRQVHSNGLIEFEEGERVRSDGAFVSDVLQWKIQKAEEELENAETEQEIAEAESRLEKVFFC